MSTISSLPNEILVTIFHFLTQEEKAVVATVCKKWYCVVDLPVLWQRNSVAYIGDYNATCFETIVRRKVSKVHLCNGFDYRMIPFNIVDIDCGRRYSTVVTLLQCKKNVLRTLKCLNVSGCFDLTDMDLEKIFLIAPNITNLNVEQCVRLSDAAMRRIAYYLTVTSLNVNQCVNITMDGMQFFLNNGKSHLISKLCMSQMWNVDFHQLVLLIHKCKFLKEIEMSFCYKWNCQLFQQIVDALCYLESFVININLIFEENVLIAYIQDYRKYLCKKGRGQSRQLVFRIMYYSNNGKTLAL